MSSDSPNVFLLDDDPGVVVALGRILRTHGIASRAWTSASEFVNAHDAHAPGCLVTDLRMPGMSGLEVQRALLARGIDRPVIFITAHGDMRTTVLGMKAGAVTFLSKPVQAAELVGAVREAFARDATRRAHRCERAEVSARLAQLSPRERQVLRLMTSGMLNKQIAAELGAAEKTVKVHRRRLLDKMRVRTATAVVSLLSRADLLEAARSVVVQKRARPESAAASGPTSAATSAASAAHTFGAPGISRTAQQPPRVVRDSWPATSVAGVLSRGRLILSDVGAT